MRGPPVGVDVAEHEVDDVVAEVGVAGWPDAPFEVPPVSHAAPPSPSSRRGSPAARRRRNPVLMRVFAVPSGTPSRRPISSAVHPPKHGEHDGPGLLRRQRAQPGDDPRRLDAARRLLAGDVGVAVAAERRLQQPVELVVVGRRAAPRPHGVDGDVAGDRQQPRGDRAAHAVVRRRRPPRPQERLLGDVVGERRIAGDRRGRARTPSAGSAARTPSPRRRPRPPARRRARRRRARRGTGSTRHRTTARRARRDCGAVQSRSAGRSYLLSSCPHREPEALVQRPSFPHPTRPPTARRRRRRRARRSPRAATMTTTTPRRPTRRRPPTRPRRPPRRPRRTPRRRRSRRPPSRRPADGGDGRRRRLRRSVRSSSTADGMTLYMFVPDDAGREHVRRGLPRGVAGDPRARRPPATASTRRCSPPRRGPDDGSEQATCDGWPLYTFAQDAAPGDVTGQGVGDKWYVLDATCTPIGMDARRPPRRPPPRRARRSPSPSPRSARSSSTARA